MNGTAEIPGRILEMERPQLATYEFHAGMLSLSGGDAAQVTEAAFQFRMTNPPGGATIRTDLTLRNGEKVVVGTATLASKGLILVLSA